MTMLPSPNPLAACTVGIANPPATHARSRQRNTGNGRGTRRMGTCGCCCEWKGLRAREQRKIIVHDPDARPRPASRRAQRNFPAAAGSNLPCVDSQSSDHNALFETTEHRRPVMRRSFTVVSIVVHSFVVAAVGIAQLLAVGPLPDPHAPLTFAGAIPVRVIDIPLPPQRRSAASAPAASPSGRRATPLGAPKETGADRSSPNKSTAVPATVGAGRGISWSDAFGLVKAIEPVPPPAPPPQ